MRTHNTSAANGLGDVSLRLCRQPSAVLVQYSTKRGNVMAQH